MVRQPPTCGATGIPAKGWKHRKVNKKSFSINRMIAHKTPEWVYVKKDSKLS